MATNNPNNIPNSPNYNTPDTPFGERPFLSQLIDNQEEFECFKQKVYGSELTHSQATLIEYKERCQYLIDFLILSNVDDKESLLTLIKLIKDIFDNKICLTSLPSIAGEQVEYFINLINKYETELY